MLAEEDEHSLVEDVDIAVVGLTGRPSLKVHDGERQVPVFPTAFQQSVRKVDVFTVHEEILVEQSYGIERLVA